MTNQTRKFSSVIWEFIILYKKESDDFIKKNLKGALKTTSQKMTDQPVNYVSKGVLDLCNAREIDPFSLLWPQRNILGTDEKGRSLLLWEHTTPLAELFNTLVECSSYSAVLDVLESYSGVCWITRQEDDRLNSSGFRSKRPEGWRTAYAKCGIEIINKK